MADPRAFISFDFDHNEDEKKYFAGQAKNSRTPFNIADWSSKSNLPQSTWEKIIEEKINKCNMITYRSLKSGRNRKILISSEHERSLEH